MKITLVSIFPDLQSFGIRTISACLKKDGHDVDLIFLQKDFSQRFADKTMDDLLKLTKKSDLDGFSRFAPNHLTLRDTAVIRVFFHLK